MKNFNQILAFGGSHSAGYSLVPLDLELLFNGKVSVDEGDDITKPFSYPNLLADKFNIPCYNYSRTGASDDRSLRLLPEKLLQHKDSFVLFPWIEPTRTEFFYPDDGKYPARDRDNYLQTGINWLDHDADNAELSRFKRNKKTDHPILNVFLIDIYRSTAAYNNYKLFNGMLYVELLCKKYSIDYRHYFYHDRILENDTFQKEIWDQIDKTKILKLPGEPNHNLGFGSYEGFHKMNNSKIIEQGHFDRSAHADFANYLYEQIK